MSSQVDEDKSTMTSCAAFRDRVAHASLFLPTGGVAPVTVSCKATSRGEKKKKKKTAEPRYHRLFEYNVHCYLITCSNRAGQQRPASVSSYDVIVQSRGGEVARCGAVRCGADDPAAFSIAFAAGVTGLYGKVGGLNARPSRSTNWGKPGASRPVNEGG